MKLRQAKGGDVKLTARNQKLTGKIIADKDSTLDINLENCNFNGNINNDNKAKKVVLTIGSGSNIELTGNCYVDELNISDNAKIVYNGYKIIERT